MATCQTGSQYGFLDDLDLARGYFWNTSAPITLTSPLAFWRFDGNGTVTYNGTALAGRAGLLTQTYDQLQDFAPANWTLYWLSAGPDVELWVSSAACLQLTLRVSRPPSSTRRRGRRCR